MKIDRRKIVLLMASLICTILSAQTKGEYISTHFKRGDSIQYVYKLSVKTTNPTTGKPIDFPDDIYENLACSSVWSYYLLNEIREVLKISSFILWLACLLIFLAVRQVSRL